MFLDKNLNKFIDLDFEKRIKALLPSDMSVSLVKIEKDLDFDVYSYLSQKEKDLLKESAVLKRKKEFFMGRLAATNALRQLVSSDDLNISILKDEVGAPKFVVNEIDSDYLGSISHCGDYAISIVGSKKSYHAVGVDIIWVKRNTNNRILETICSQEELAQLLAQWTDSLELLRLAVFSVKESLYKVFSFLGFRKMEWADLKLTKIKKESFGVVFTMQVLPKLLSKGDKAFNKVLLDELEIKSLLCGDCTVSFLWIQK